MRWVNVQEIYADGNTTLENPTFSIGKRILDVTFNYGPLKSVLPILSSMMVLARN